MKKNTIFAVFFASFWIAPPQLGAAAPHTEAGIATIVNNQMVSQTQLNQRIKLALISANVPDSQQARQELAPQILSVMEDELIQLQIGETYKIKIDKALLEHSLHEIEKQNNMGTGALHNMLIQNGIPVEIMEQHLNANLIWRDYIRERYKDSIQITDDEVTRALAEQQAAKKSTRFELYEIVVHNGGKNQKSNAQQSIQKIINLLRTGAPFPALAMQFSNAPSANRGGNLGWVTATTLDEKIAAAVKNLQTGEISAPVHSDQGIALYYVKERLEPGQYRSPQTFLTFKQVIIPHPQNAFEFEVMENLNRAKAIARTVKGCRIVDKIAQGKNMVVQNVKHVPLSSLPLELNNLLKNLKVDQASMPVATEQGALFFVLCDKETLNPQEPSADEIRENLTERKLQLVAEREMRNRRQSAHIDRRFKT